MSRVAVIGLDSAAPWLVFELWRDQLPNLTRLMRRGVWGEMRSTHPPITVPAWASMMTGKDPGQLGLYGFRNRRAYTYDDYAFASSRSIAHDAVWDIASRAGRKVILLGVPPSYPPRPVNGCVVSCFLTPSKDSTYTYPPSLREEVERVADGYQFDVDNFRSDDKQDLLRRIYAKTHKQFAVARHLVATKPWDFFMMVEMGIDRVQHAFWKYFDRGHPKHQPGNPFQDAVRDYYRHVDEEVGELLALLGPDTTVMVVSDHGAKRLVGGICVNEWLIERGYLRLNAYPGEVVPLSPRLVDWSATKVWGDGGYYARLFLNVQGREPEGVIARADYEKVRDDLIAEIAEMEDPHGRPLGSRAYRPEELYREVNGVAPDLLVYFGDLDWRSVGSVGFNSIYTFDNDTGPDDANHDWNGIFIFAAHDQSPTGREIQGLQLMDVAPTVLGQLDLAVPRDMQGRGLFGRRVAEDVRTLG